MRLEGDQTRRRPHARLLAAEPPASLAEDCGEIERCLLVLARFTGGRRHHATTLQTAGVGRLESAAERKARHAQARARRAADPAPWWWTNDPLAGAAPLSMHAARQVDAGLYPVLAVIEDLNRARPIDIARALTLDRSTVARHLDTLERRGLVFRERGIVRNRRSRVGLTAVGFTAVKALRSARISRLEAALGAEPRLERRLMLLSLRRLAEALHGETALPALPRPLLEPDARDGGLWPRALPPQAGLLGKRR
jgi:DNA-binding MarR family transcriptional regulator